jgi:hypothetical protein
MTARDAISRLNRNLAATAGRDSFPNRWPLDHVDMAAGDFRSIERIIIPPGNRSQIICGNWPECACQSDCADLEPKPMPLWKFLAIAAIPVAVIVGCLVWRALHG